MDQNAENELLKKAMKPGKDSMALHPFYKGKIEITLKAPVRDYNDFAIWYTPGVAEPCKAIAAKPELVFDYTNKWNSVAVVSDGTRVLGLGDIGPKAGLPVMEGKALLFKYLGGVDAFPLMLDTKDPDQIVQCVKWIQPGIGGINLEDISQPKCFDILDRLRKEADIPVWHDDQQGTAAIIIAGLINALKIVNKSKQGAKIALIGAGAANLCTARMLECWGYPLKNLVIVDSKGALGPWREELAKDYRVKWDMANRTNSEGVEGGIAEAMKGADAVIAASRPGPDILKQVWISNMADRAIVFACANPVPEIWPWKAKEAGAEVVATGRSDFPNQVNNSLGFPGIFRGTLDVRATTITDEMCIAAAIALASRAEQITGGDLDPEMIIPSMDDWEVFPQEAVAVGLKAIEQGHARVKLSKEELYDKATAIISRARGITEDMMKNGWINKAPL